MYRLQTTYFYDIPVYKYDISLDPNTSKYLLRKSLGVQFRGLIPSQTVFVLVSIHILHYNAL